MIVLKNSIFNMITDYLYGFDIALENYLDTAYKELSIAIRTDSFLFEKYYNLNNKIDFLAFSVELANNLKNFYNSEIFKIVKSKQLKDVIIPTLEEDIGQFDFLDYTIFFMPDLIVDNETSKLIINFFYDITRENFDDYLAWTMALSYLFVRAYNIAEFEKLVFINYSLRDNIFKQANYNERQISKKIDELKKSIILMQKFQNETDIEKFYKTNNNEICKFCNFQKLCF